METCGTQDYMIFALVPNLNSWSIMLSVTVFYRDRSPFVRATSIAPYTDDISIEAETWGEISNVNSLLLAPVSKNMFKPY